MTGRIGKIVTAPVWCLAFLWATATCSSAATQDPKAFIQSLGNEALGLLQQQELAPDQRVAEFRRLFVKGFDVDKISRLVLGRYWRKATAAEREEFRSVFEDFVVKSYADRLSNYSGEAFTIQSATKRNETESVVQSTIVRPTGPPTRVDWRIDAASGEQKIVDVAIEGVSMLVTQRSEFASVIRSNGGRVSSLIAALRKQVSRLN